MVVTFSRLKRAIKAALETLGERDSLILIPSDPKVILELAQKSQEAQVAEQLRQLQKSVYHMASRINDQTEHVNALTTTLQEIQHDLDQAGSRVVETVQTPEALSTDQVLQVARAWKRSNGKSWLTRPDSKKTRPD